MHHSIISKVHIDLWQYDLAQFHLSLWCTLVKVVSSSGGNGERRATTDARSSSFWTGAKSFLIQSSYRNVQQFERTNEKYFHRIFSSECVLTYLCCCVVSSSFDLGKKIFHLDTTFSLEFTGWSSNIFHKFLQNIRSVYLGTSYTVRAELGRTGVT